MMKQTHTGAENGKLDGLALLRAEPGDSFGMIELSEVMYYVPNARRKNVNAALTMDKSRPVIAEPWDRPMMPSYWFFDSSSDHHRT
jgi:hypothetical protein